MTLESTLAGTWHPGPEREIRAQADAWELAVAWDTAPSVAWREGATFGTFQAEVFHE